MKQRILVTFLLLWFLLAGLSPAYANNPPAPDGMLSLVLIFPVAILGFRLAGAELTEKELQKKWRILRGIFLGLCTLAAAAGTEIGFAAMLVLLCYGLLRGRQVIRRGQGGKRFAIGPAVILFALFAALNYLVSINRPTTAGTESGGVSGILHILVAENQFRSEGKLDANKNAVAEYGTLDQLHQAGVLDDHYWRPSPLRGYRYEVVLAGDPVQDEREFLVYATPTDYGETRAWGISLVEAMRSPRRPARRTFASAETGVIREADLGGSRPVTRQEIQKWKKRGE